MVIWHQTVTSWHFLFCELVDKKRKLSWSCNVSNTSRRTYRFLFPQFLQLRKIVRPLFKNSNNAHGNENSTIFLIARSACLQASFAAFALCANRNWPYLSGNMIQTVQESTAGEWVVSCCLDTIRGETLSYNQIMSTLIWMAHECV